MARSEGPPRGPRGFSTNAPTPRPAMGRAPGSSPPPPPSRRPGVPSPPPPGVDEDEDEATRRNIPLPRTSLDEVEQALSALDGRHHAAAAAERHNLLAAAAKRAADEAASKAEAARERRSLLLRASVGLVVCGSLAAAAAGGKARYDRTRAADAALAAAAAPYVMTGWKAFERPLWRPRDRAEVTIGASMCVVALSSRTPGDGKVVVDRPLGPALQGDGSLAFCTCVDERVAVHTVGHPEGGVQILYKDAALVGGNLALPFVAPRPASLPARDSCPVDPLDGWLAAGHGASPPSTGGLDASLQRSIEAVGFHLNASAQVDRPFAVVAGAADSCFVAVGTVPGDALSLRLQGGAHPVQAPEGGGGALAWCTHVAQPVTVAHEGAGSVVVFRAPTSHVPGTPGVIEALGGVARLAKLPLWVSPGERGWDASAALLASGVLPADITVPRDARPVLHTRVVSLSTFGVHVTPEPDELDRYLCSPSLEVSPHAAVCVQSSALGWKPARPDSVGIAEAALPFWMDIMTHVEDRQGLAVELQLLTLSRALAREGFEATARDMVLEEPQGVEIVGRAGDDRVVAVGLLASSPWVLPYTDGAAWTFDQAPRVVPIAEGEHLHLTTHPWVKAPPEVRRTVVFRHRKGS